MQVKATRMNAFTTCLNIANQGGVPALYAGLILSLLQVCFLQQRFCFHICSVQHAYVDFLALSKTSW
jgi:hypothetical protein